MSMGKFGPREYNFGEDFFVNHFFGTPISLAISAKGALRIDKPARLSFSCSLDLLLNLLLISIKQIQTAISGHNIGITSL